MAQGHICGFYYSTYRPENPYWNQWQRHYLPQVSLKSHTTILSRTSRTVLTQTFTHYDQTKAIKNVRYTFPLYDGVSVVGFTCRVGDRIIKGQVKEKETAKADFDAAVERGETAGLLEQLPDASDVFTTTIGNIPPGATLVSEITYLGELKHDAEIDGIRFTIPTAIAPRYGEYPGELLSKADTPSAQDNYGMEIVVDVVLHDYGRIRQVLSPTHPVAVSMGTTSVHPEANPLLTKASATLSLGTAELEKDFVLQVIANDIITPTAYLEVHPRIPRQRALMATLVPRFQLPSIKPEIVFICDRSGSMSGSRIATARSALRVFLKSLPLGVKFNICSFGSSYSFLWPKSKSYTQDSLNEALCHVETFDSNYGGTEIFAPLQASIANRYKDMELEVMLLTDGDVWQHEVIFAYLNEQIQEKKDPIRVFTLGVGLNASSALVEGVARAGNGFSQAVGDNEKLDGKVVRMLRGALTPHINDYSLEVRYTEEKKSEKDTSAEDGFEIIEKVTDSLRVDLKLQDGELKEEEKEQKKPISLFDESVNLDTTHIDSTSSDGADRFAHLPPLNAPAILQAPSRIPSLFPFNRTTIYMLLSPNSPAAERTPTSVILRGTSKQGPLELEIPVSVLAENDGKNETIHQLAARKAILELEEGRGWLVDAVDPTGTKLQENMEGRWDELVQREAVRLGVDFQVGGKWCSFVALEEHSKETNDEMDRDWEYLDIEPQAPSGTSLQPHRNGGQRRRTLNPQNLRQLSATNTSPRVGPEKTLADYQRGLMLLEQQSNGNRRVMYRSSSSSTTTTGGNRSGIRGGGGGPGGHGARHTSLEAARNAARFSMASQASSPQIQMQQQAAPDGGMLAARKKKKVKRAPADEGNFASYGAAAAFLEPSTTHDRDQTLPNVEIQAQMVDWDALTPLETLVELQSFEGCWEWEDRLLRLVGVSREAAAQSSVVPGRLAATALAVVFLRRRLARESESWALVVEKAEAWVEASEGPGGGDWGRLAGVMEGLVEKV